MVARYPSSDVRPPHLDRDASEDEVQRAFEAHQDDLDAQGRAMDHAPGLWGDRW